MHLIRIKIFAVAFLLSIPVFSQDNNDTEDLQTKEFNLANEYLKNAYLTTAINSFYYVNRLNSKTLIGNISVKRADSLKIILRKNLITELTGNWKMFDDVPSWVMREDSIVGKMIQINSNEIQFYELIKNAKSWKLVKPEKILYSDSLSGDSSYSELIYSNNEIWQYSIDEKTGYLNLTYTGDKTETGRTEIICGTVTKTYFKLQ
ncbi:hypothetical protein [Flavobacterium sp. Root420]|uniref:hypothetical protein n=1 Tax=Flavobacterium sp. Root420 TaxID=1736533 RepID=UPI0006FB4C67|nr:hypothetical protein [Flavobacterium sp. Root420]KQX15916.1 hypothetical protein ASC72_03335 [Flavobacterium sp. Root420]